MTGAGRIGAVGPLTAFHALGDRDGVLVVETFCLGVEFGEPLLAEPGVGPHCLVDRRRRWTRVPATGRGGRRDRGRRHPDPFAAPRPHEQRLEPSRVELLRSPHPSRGTRSPDAVGHHLLVVMWWMLHEQFPYAEMGADYLARRVGPERRKRQLIHQLEQLGVNVNVEFCRRLTPHPATSAARPVGARDPRTT